MVEEGKFRNDLYYRLNVVPLRIPPLRNRKEDIEPLSLFFINKFRTKTKKNFTGISESALARLYDYDWPGNIRELENAIERACVMGVPPCIKFEDLGLIVNEKSEESSKTDRFSKEFSDIMDGNDMSLKTATDTFKKKYIMKVLEMTKNNQTKAAKILDIQRTYLARLLNELGIR